MIALYIRVTTAVSLASVMLISPLSYWAFLSQNSDFSCNHAPTLFAERQKFIVQLVFTSLAFFEPCFDCFFVGNNWDNHHSFVFSITVGSCCKTPHLTKAAAINFSASSFSKVKIESFISVA